MKAYKAGGWHSHLVYFASYVAVLARSGNTLEVMKKEREEREE